MPNNPQTGRAGTPAPVTAANKIVRRGAQETTVTAIVSTPKDNVSAPPTTTPDSSLIIPTGIIVMWSGTLASIPSGWALCDGTGGTPDLRDKFIYGWTAATDPGGTGGTLQHLHGFGTIAAAAESAHTHTFTQSANAATPDLVAADVTGAGVAASGTTGAGSSHTHAISGSTANNTSGNALPPYFKLAFLMKLAA